MTDCRRCLEDGECPRHAVERVLDEQAAWFSEYWSADNLPQGEVAAKIGIVSRSLAQVFDDEAARCRRLYPENTDDARWISGRADAMRLWANRLGGTSGHD